MDAIIGSKIRKVRELKGFTQEYLASKIGLSQNAVSKIEKGQIKIDDKLFTTIASAPEVDKEAILNFNDNYVFTNCSNPGNYNNYQIHPIEAVLKLNEKLLQSKDEIINALKGQIETLQALLKVK
jgi:transcriptional regulator with XRE-family HTH domain